MYCFGIASEYNSKAYKVDITKESVNIVEFFKEWKGAGQTYITSPEKL